MTLRQDRESGQAVVVDEVPAGFVEEVRRFLDARLERLPDPATLAWGEGDDALPGEPARSEADDARWLDAARELRRAEYDAGLGWLTGPKTYGGRELPIGAERIFRDLKDGYRIPRPDPFTISLGMVAPAILRHGTPEVRERYLRGLYRGDLIGCQMFSEPEAGSDLAGLRTLAVRDGDGWRITGQKVWTSLAQHASIGEILCRTDPAKPKHAGLTAFILDMNAPGVEVRPLRQMTGGRSFNEIFLNDVHVPDSHRLGDVDGGWAVAISTLMGERALGVGRDLFGVQEAMRRLLQASRRLAGPADDPLRDRVVRCWIEARVVQLNGMRSESRLRSGLPPGPEESMTKISNTETMRQIADVAEDLIGPALVADTGQWGTSAWAGWAMYTAGCRIAAGTDEVLRNILAERVLRLPKDVPVGS